MTDKHISITITRSFTTARGKQKCPQRVLEHGLGFSKDEECKSTVECVAEDRVLCQANKGGVAEAGFNFFAAAPAAFAATTTSTTLVGAASSTTSSAAAAATTAATSAAGVQTTFSAGLGLLSLFLSALPEFGVAQQQQQTAASSTSVVTSGTTADTTSNPLAAPTTSSITGIDSQYFDEGTLTAGSEDEEYGEPYFEPLPEPEQDEVTSKEDEDFQKNTTGGTAASSTTSNAAASSPDKHNRPKDSFQQNQINQFKQPKNNLDLESLCHGLADPGSGKNSTSTSSSSFRTTGGNKVNPNGDSKNSGRSGNWQEVDRGDHRQLLEFDADGEVIF